MKPDKNLKIGRIIEVNGNHVKVELDESIKELYKVYQNEVYSIGQFGSIIKSFFGDTIIYMYVNSLRLKSDIEAERGNTIPPSEDSRILEADLFGEGKIIHSSKESIKFERGVSTYPLPQQDVYLTTFFELKNIYNAPDYYAVKIGTYVGTKNIPCYADLNEMTSKHTAILGSTGAGKSATVSAILQSIKTFSPKSTQEWHPHIIILDPHDEYQKAFPESHKLNSDEGSLLLPFWLLDLNELIDLFIGKTEFQATSQINILKKAIISLRKENAHKTSLDPDEITVDSPIPFSLDGLIKKIEDDKPPQESKQEKHNSIINKIDALRNDARLAFLMNCSSDEDNIVEIIQQFVNSNSPMKIVDLSGIPNNVAGIVTAVIARLLFTYKLWESPEERKIDPVLLVCEEAHRYVPNRGEAEYKSAQEAIKRIAKEGRKYGLGILLVTQRPSEIEPTVLSQCNTWIVLRLTNPEDQSHVMRMLPDSLNGLANVLPSLRNREAIFIGQATTVPARIMINKLSDDLLPNSSDINYVDGWSSIGVEKEHIARVIKRWRKQERDTVDLSEEVYDK